MTNIRYIAYGACALALAGIVAFSVTQFNEKERAKIAAKTGSQDLPTSDIGEGSLLGSTTTLDSDATSLPGMTGEAEELARGRSLSNGSRGKSATLTNEITTLTDR